MFVVGRTVQVAALALVVLAAVTCTSSLPLVPGSSITSPRTEDPASLIAVPTQEPRSAETPEECPGALIEGPLIADSRWGIALDDTAGFVRKVLWPYGYSARRDERVVLLDESGRVVAGEGDLVSIGGGEISGNGPWLACGAFKVVGSE